MTAIVQVQYVGPEDSALITADGEGQTITSRIGAAGAEAEDPDFGTLGAIDIGGYETLDSLVAVIDGYDHYSARLFLGDQTSRPTGMQSGTSHAESGSAFLVFSTPVVLQEQALVSWTVTKQMLDLDDAQEDVVVRLINAVSLIANRQHAKRHLAAKDYLFFLDGDNEAKLLLPQAPINTVTEVRVDTSWAFGEETIVTDYRTNSEDGSLLRTTGGYWPSGPEGIMVKSNCGFQPVPSDLQIAAIEAVSFNLHRFTGHGIGIGAKLTVADGMNLEHELTIPVNAQRVFESYRL